MNYLSKGSISNFLIWISVLFFFFGCSEIKSATKPSSSTTPTTQQPKGRETSAKPPSKPSSVSPTKPLPPPPSPAPKVTPPPPLRLKKVVWNSVNLREGPGTTYKVIGNVKKGTSLAVLEAKEDWLHVRLEDGSEAWVSRLATSDTPKPPPPTPPKPAPM